MGTRGTFGVCIDGRLMMGYNQFDSYPDGMGQENVAALRAELADDYEAGLARLRALARACRLVSEKITPSAEDIEALKGVTDLAVSSRSTADWYCLTRDTHGHILDMLRCGYIDDHRNFANDSLFCEWGYVLDLDTEMFEVYEGYQKDEHALGRFKRVKPNTDGYYPIKLIAAIPLRNLPKDLPSVLPVRVLEDA